MTSWLPNATDGLLAALIASATGVGTSLLRKRSEKPAKRDAWQAQARAVESELRRANAAALADRDQQIGYLRAQVTERDTQIKDQAREIARLNRGYGHGSTGGLDDGI
jgi:hypothetical protein